MKILIVDDSKFNRINARDTILNNDIECEILMCNSGKEAIEIVKSQKIDIVLLDIVMPEMSGLEVLEKLNEKNNKRSIIFIMYTSLVDKQYLKRSFELGASDFINKPIEPIEFISRVKSAIKMKEYYNALLDSFNKIIDSNNKLKETNIKLQKAQLELINKEKLASIGRFSAAIAHEVNSPLGYISSNISMLDKYSNSMIKQIGYYRSFMEENEQILSDSINLDKINEVKDSYNKLKIDYIKEDFRALIDETKDGISKISKIVDNIVSFSYSNPDEGYEINNFNEILEESMIILKSELKIEDIDEIIKSDIDISKDEYIFCNRVQIQQVITNIIENSIYFIKKQNRNDKGTVRIHTYNDDSYFYCVIEDDGPGIKADILDKVFEPFFTTKDIGEGIGLGLSICYDIIVTKHKGEININSELGKGTKVTIKLKSNINNNRK